MDTSKLPFRTSHFWVFTHGLNQEKKGGRENGGREKRKKNNVSHCLDERKKVRRKKNSSGIHTKTFLQSNKEKNSKSYFFLQ